MRARAWKVYLFRTNGIAGVARDFSSLHFNWKPRVANLWRALISRDIDLKCSNRNCLMKFQVPLIAFCARDAEMYQTR